MMSYTLHTVSNKNGIAGRKKINCTQAKGIQNSFQAEEPSTVVYTSCSVTSRFLPSSTASYHLWYGKASDMSHLRVFEPKCWYKSLSIKSRSVTLVPNRL